MARLGDDDALALSDHARLEAELFDRMRVGTGASGRRTRLLRFNEEQFVRIATRDLLDMDDISTTAGALSTVADVILDSAIRQIEPEVPFCVIGLGRFGGGELSYQSDLDVIFVHANSDGPGSQDTGRHEPESDHQGETAGSRASHPTATAGPGELAAERLLRLVHGSNPAERIFNVDLGLRPEGGHGRLSRDIDGFTVYFERWAQTWERQALLRARVVAGDPTVGEEFLELANRFVWEPPIGDNEVTEIRRMKARIERERIPAGEDPQFHLKLGKGSLSDVEWTVQLLQLRNRVIGAGTMGTLDELERVGAIAGADARALRDSYRFCDHTRNRWHLVGALPGGASPGDSLPAQAHQMSRLARSLGTTPAALREDYRRVTRRARGVMERLFYGIQGPGPGPRPATR
jgi:glutamate-ammonia-ligase adenylyltransferase